MKRLLMGFIWFASFSAYAEKEPARFNRPVGQLNILTNLNQSLYLNCGGPGFVSTRETSSLGLQFVPTLKYQKTTSGSPVTPGLGVQAYSRFNHWQINVASFYQAPKANWNLAFGLGYVWTSR
jgi:hypothetical protein